MIITIIMIIINNDNDDLVIITIMTMITQGSPQHSLVGELMNKFGFSDILEYQVSFLSNM